MKASTYVRRHQGELADAVLKTLMDYHKCSLHNGPGSGACLADFKRADLIMDTFTAQQEDHDIEYEAHIRLYKSDEWDSGILPWDVDRKDREAVVSAVNKFAADHPLMYEGAEFRVVEVVRSVIHEVEARG